MMALNLKHARRIHVSAAPLNPPTLSDRVIRSLGMEFGKVQRKLLFDEELKKKPLSKKVAGPRVKQSRNTNPEDPNEDIQKKKNRKK
jgi:hypothetical protein